MEGVNDMPRGWVNGKNQPYWHRVIYSKWRNMWIRVYSQLEWFGCTIQPEYKYLSNFVEDIMKLDNFELFKENPKGWSIDKDIKGGTHIGYYFEYLSLITRSDNSKERNKRNPNKTPKKSIRGISLKDGSIIIFESVNEAKDSGFNPCNIINCLKGRNNSHKGYKWEYIVQEVVYGIKE